MLRYHLVALHVERIATGLNYVDATNVCTTYGVPSIDQFRALKIDCLGLTKNNDYGLQYTIKYSLYYFFATHTHNKLSNGVLLLYTGKKVDTFTDRLPGCGNGICLLPTHS
jgi:hypothetical protein